jgi:hypothetical protein
MGLIYASTGTPSAGAAGHQLVHLVVDSDGGGATAVVGTGAVVVGSADPEQASMTRAAATTA